MMRRLTAFLLVVLLFTAGCINRLSVGRTQVETQSVELGQAETAQVFVDMGVGELALRGGAENLLDAEFTYNIEDWKPEIEYEVNGSRGLLNVRQPSGDFEGIPDSDVEYKWDLQLNNDVPLDMDVDLGVGDSFLTVEGLQLQSLNVRTGVGEATVDLSGDWRESFNVDINAGIGKLTLIVPREVGVIVKPSTGLGDQNVFGLIQQGSEYVNEVYGRSDVTLDITVDGGIGDIEIRLAD